MARRPSLDAHTLDLLDRMHRAATLGEALGVLAGVACAAAECRRVLVMLARRGILRAEAGHGWEPAEARGLEVSCGDPDAAAADAFRAGELRTQAAEGSPPGQTPFAALPVPAPDGGSLGVVLLDGADARGMDAAAELVRRAGPAVARLVELESLRTAARQVSRQRDLLGTLVDALPDPLLVTDSEHGILRENERAAALFSVRDGDGDDRRRMAELNNLLFSSFLVHAASAAWEGGRELSLLEPETGADLVFEVLSAPLPGHLAGDGARLAALRDVTALKRASNELEHQFRRARTAETKARAERDRMNLVLENVGDPIVVTGEDGDVLLVNRQGERLFRVPHEVPADAPPRLRVAANDSAVSAFVADLAASRDVTRAAEMMLADPATGAELPVEVVSGKILGEGGEMVAIVSILHDQTRMVENARLAAELARLNEGLEGRIHAATQELEERNRRLEWQSRELERASRLKSEFLASMSHELRTPINALLGYASLMRDRIYGELTQRQEESLVRMQSASRHLLDLVNDILDLAKIEAGKMPVHAERFALADLVQELSETVEPLVRARGLEYRTETPEELPELFTDRTKVKQIVLNLLSNAVKFTHVGRVALTVRVRRGGVEMEVRDTGIGIPPAELETIWDDFRQVDQSSTREYGGTGLGLSIVRKLALLLGGSVRARSQPGRGSVFTVRLPARVRTAPDHARDGAEG
ncbi:MAG TPA: ATP-binding protein [Longimicrobiaceae bacterium]|nr:ATP-binding protein [Longimicrobiaceae bacterium]